MTETRLLKIRTKRPLSHFLDQPRPKLLTKRRADTWKTAHWTLLLFLLVTVGCSSDPTKIAGTSVGPVPCTGDPVGGDCSNGEFLSVEDVEQVIAQAVDEARANGVENATIAVLDRVNNVLAVWQMMPGDAPFDPVNPSAIYLSQIGLGGGSEESGLVGISVPNTLAAISKAGRASFLSSQGNAFSTRTAGQIIQPNFNPGELYRPGGPLFGVQFSQLPCNPFSDRAYAEPQRGPKRLPLGFAADSGGLPLYKGGVAVGAVAVEFDGRYDADEDVSDVDAFDLEERVTVAASFCFGAPKARRASRITIDGRALRFIEDDNLVTAPDCDQPGILPPVEEDGALVPVTGWYGDFLSDGITPSGDPVIREGTPLIDPATNASGFREVALDSPFTPSAVRCVVNGVDFGPGVCATVLVDPGAGSVNRFPPKQSSSPSEAEGGLTSSEVQEILYQVLKLAERTRAQARLPIGEPARINVAVVDKAGETLGLARSRDALIFSLHLALQKAQTAVFFSDAPVSNLKNAPAPLFVGLVDPPTQSFKSYGTALDEFFDGTYLPVGTAFSTTAVGSLAQPFYPTGQNFEPEGPLSRSIDTWSPFSTGFQSDSILAQTAFSLCRQVPEIREVLKILDPSIVNPSDCPDPASIQTCTIGGELSQLDLGPTIFSGGFPIYRLNETGPELIGGVGVSGDGVEQDNVIGMVGLAEAARNSPSPVRFGHPPSEIRVNELTARGVRARYAVCAVSPFLGSDEQQACEGL